MRAWGLQYSIDEIAAMLFLHTAAGTLVGYRLSCGLSTLKNEPPWGHEVVPPGWTCYHDPAYGVAARAASAVVNPEPAAFAGHDTVLVVPSGLGTVRLPAPSGIALASRIPSTCDAVSAGFFCAMSATIPVTCGEAIDVPLKKKKLGRRFCDVAIEPPAAVARRRPLSDPARGGDGDHRGIGAREAHPGVSAVPGGGDDDDAPRDREIDGGALHGVQPATPQTPVDDHRMAGERPGLEIRDVHVFLGDQRRPPRAILIQHLDRDD